MTFDFFLQFDLISSKDLKMSVFLHYFHEIFFLSNYHCVLYTTAIELLFARIRGHCALYWRPFSASLQRPRDFQSFPSMSKKNTQTSNHKFLLWQKFIHCNLTNFCKLPYQQNIYNHETALKNSATSKDQQFLLQCISFCSFFPSSLLLGRCDNQLFRNPAKFGPQTYTVLC